jgi:hypothetical protein
MMNTQPLEKITHLDDTATLEAEVLVEDGFNEDEIVSLLWLRQWYQQGGSDRVEIVRRLEFLKLLILQGRITL